MKRFPAANTGLGPKISEKGLEDFLSLSYPYTVEETEEEGKKIYILSYPDLPGCWAEGESFEESLRKLEDAKKAWILASLNEGLPIPEPIKEDDFKGKILLRIPPKLHMRLSKNSEKRGTSLNKYIWSLLEEKTENQILEAIKALRAIQETCSRLFLRLESLEKSYNSLSQEVRWLKYRRDIGLGIIETDEAEVPSAWTSPQQETKEEAA